MPRRQRSAAFLLALSANSVLLQIKWLERSKGMSRGLNGLGYQHGAPRCSSPEIAKILEFRRNET